jgi:hypothetical protein
LRHIDGILNFYLFFSALHVAENGNRAFKMENFKNAIIGRVYVFKGRGNFQGFFFGGPCGVETYRAVYSQPLSAGTGADFNMGIGLHLPEHVFFVVGTKAEFAFVVHYKAHGPHPGLAAFGASQKKGLTFCQKLNYFFQNNAPLSIFLSYERLYYFSRDIYCRF